MLASGGTRKTKLHAKSHRKCKNLKLCQLRRRRQPRTPHNTCRHLIVYMSFFKIYCFVFFFSPCTHQTDNITMFFLSTAKTFCATSDEKGKKNEKLRSKQAETVWPQSSHGKHVKKRIFMFVCLFWERRTGNVSARSRHQKKALWFQTRVPTREHQQSVGVLLEATTERNAPPAGVEGDYLCRESLHSNAWVQFVAITDSS